MKVKVVDKRISTSMYVYSLEVVEPKELQGLHVLYGLDASEWTYPPVKRPLTRKEADEEVRKMISEVTGIPINQIKLEIEEKPFKL